MNGPENRRQVKSDFTPHGDPIPIQAARKKKLQFCTYQKFPAVSTSPPRHAMHSPTGFGIDLADVAGRREKARLSGAMFPTPRHLPEAVTMHNFLGRINRALSAGTSVFPSFIAVVLALTLFVMSRSETWTWHILGHPVALPLSLFLAGAVMLFPILQPRELAGSPTTGRSEEKVLSNILMQSSAHQPAPDNRGLHPRPCRTRQTAPPTRVQITVPKAANDQAANDFAAPASASRIDEVAKRILDVLLAGSAILFLLPVLLLVALWIRIDSPGPVIFRQHRRGLEGKPFEILKFRSMRVLENGSDVRQAQRHDDRVTRVGRIIRATSLDELPQLINVLKGEMSLVGPRPHAMAHDDHYSKLIESYSLRQSVKPGLTGFAQVNGFRGETPELDLMISRVHCDLWYVRNRSFWLDLRILFRTFGELFRNRNVY